jgi:hypothetical protein
LALALNRAHAMFFPFNYQFLYSKKRLDERRRRRRRNLKKRGD